ncbi:hypothetical protein [Streptomyces sp. Je 1-369]|uniref:hypothetical protein n=1 Tax=Streptomyces sp. Je 1-369 TaxID=2966192 RepID=UPI0022869B95|nr:hypothetical protein [Streptomyces sp. Je 1-369]WAL93838.1 hypothetical protein NOO62_04610 [Streptomyces sp. Je 1-369]
MIDNEQPLSAADLIGRRLLKVTTAFHHYRDDAPSLQHLWLHLEGLGPVRCHTPSTGVSLLVDEPHGPYSMDECGSVTVVENASDVPVTRFVGQLVRSVREIRYDDGRVDFTAGLTLQFPDGGVRLLGLDDDLIIVLQDRQPGTGGGLT